MQFIYYCSAASHVINHGILAFDEKLDRNELEKHLQYMEEMLSYRKHLAITEMELEILQGFDVLEIGSGGGAHSALFQKYGEFIGLWKFTPEGAKVFLGHFDKLNSDLNKKEPFQSAREWQNRLRSKEIPFESFRDIQDFASLVKYF